MSESRIEIARRVCTALELQVVELEERGMSQRDIAYRLDLSRSTVRDRLDRAAQRIAGEMRRSPS